jgi:uncharacterized protein
MKKFVFIVFLVALSSASFAQEKTHKIVFQLATSDTLMHQGLTRQLNNVLKHWPTAQIEVVVHNAGLDFMHIANSTVKNVVPELQARGVVFAVCENTLRRKNVSKESIIAGAKFVPVGIAEIVEKQEEGFSYIKAGE